MSITVSISLDERRLKKTTNAYPVKLLLTLDGEPYRYQTVYDLSKENWDKLSAKHISEKLQKVKGDLNLLKKNAETYVKGKTTFSIDEFERDFIKANPLFVQRKRKRKTNSELDIPEIFHHPFLLSKCRYVSLSNFFAVVCFDIKVPKPFVRPPPSKRYS